ncbi:hypothetical protein [Paenibacillus soyae]|uniref:Uncharacterized protein n=1 Tax=Paenibacillus soyae TaxID=2969249 RepID=A0A9X2MLY8_9BACL|nr:hypothetical protein [Paenibacillus soyae]MCR2802675.1 hypothetical protein [Paenibacillus soyae]
MIPKVWSVESLILTNQTKEQFTSRFRKVIFHKDFQYLLLQQQDQFKVMKIKCCEEVVKLREANKDECMELEEYLQKWHVKALVDSMDSNEEYWVVGISFNKVVHKGCFSSEYRISDGNPLDILPYIIQTGAEHVYFSK